MEQKIIDFLRESNAIEGVYDDYSLQQASYAWEYLMSKKTMTRSVVLKTHKILMLNKPDLLPNQIGYFRMCPVYIGGHEAMRYDLVPGAVQDWCVNMNIPTGDYKQPLEEASRNLHTDYESIHPFIDGNGRTGRMFMNWWRVKNGLPVLVIHEGEEQMDYYQWFK